MANSVDPLSKRQCETRKYGVEQMGWFGKEAMTEQGEFPKKSTYYEIFFVIQEKVVPAVKGVESIFGDEVKYMGETYRKALQDFAQKA